jgi:hypothetical protein
MADKDLQRKTPSVAGQPAFVNYSANGHPPIDELMIEQGTGPITDVSVLHGDFWPQEESIEDFLATLHEWRGHQRTDPAA